MLTKSLTVSVFLYVFLSSHCNDLSGSGGGVRIFDDAMW